MLMCSGILFHPTCAWRYLGPSESCGGLGIVFGDTITARRRAPIWSPRLYAGVSQSAAQKRHQKYQVWRPRWNQTRSQFWYRKAVPKSGPLFGTAIIILIAGPKRGPDSGTAFQYQNWDRVCVHLGHQICYFGCRFWAPDRPPKHHPKGWGIWHQNEALEWRGGKRASARGLRVGGQPSTKGTQTWPPLPPPNTPPTATRKLPPSYASLRGGLVAYA